ncbi:MAG: ABC transporter permease [Spirochaetia bacterium]|jgi:NitT/TauT family transport system permease protein|nr:ABC transporter permease [Spirochaetia bacterium]
MRIKGNVTTAAKLIGEYILSISIFVLIWQIYVSTHDVPAFVLPAPKIVFVQFGKLFSSGMIWPHLWATTWEVTVGFLLGVFFGVVLGYVFAKVDGLKTALMPHIIFMQTAPKIALVPLFVVWFGIGITSKLVLIVSMVIFPVMIGVIMGIGSIPQDVRYLMKILKASKWQIFSRIEIMYSLPMIFSGLKIGIVQAVIGAIVSEWMSGKVGLGYILTYSSATYNTALLMAGIIVTVLVGIISYEIIDLAGKYLLRWHDSENTSKQQ